MQNRKRSWILWIVVGLALASLLIWSLRPQREAVELAPAEPRPLQVTLDEEGETRVRDRFVISAPVAGRLLRIELEPGDSVEEETTVVATFEPLRPVPLDDRSRAEAEAQHRGAHAALDLARSARDQKRAELDFAVLERQRFRRLATEAIVSKEKLEAMELEARRCEEDLDGAEHAVEVAAYQLQAAEARLFEGGEVATAGRGLALHSPVGGVVLRRLQESERVVPAGEPLLEVGDPAELEIVADFLSSDAVRIRPGDAALIERWGGEGALQGRVRLVEPSGFTKISALGVEEQRVNVIIDVQDPPEAREGLADGFRVEVRVVVWEADEVLTVPTGGVFRAGEGWAVYRVEGGRAAYQEVEIGHRGKDHVEILGGIAEGDTVILHPRDDIADGVRVE